MDQKWHRNTKQNARLKIGGSSALEWEVGSGCQEFRSCQAQYSENTPRKIKELSQALYFKELWMVAYFSTGQSGLYKDLLLTTTYKCLNDQPPTPTLWEIEKIKSRKTH